MKKIEKLDYLIDKTTFKYMSNVDKRKVIYWYFWKQKKFDKLYDLITVNGYAAQIALNIVKSGLDNNYPTQ